MTTRQPLALVLSLLLCLTLPVDGSAQDWNITGAGARAEGFGGAFIGIADDATAIVWNPAGLGQLERAEVTAVGRYTAETSEFKSLFPGDEFSETNRQSHVSFNFASLAVPFSAGHTNIVLAVAYQTQLDFYTKFTNINKDEIERTGAASTVTPGIACRFGSVFSLGIAANIWMGSFDYSIKYTTGETYTYTPKFSGLNFGIGAFVDLGGLSYPIPLKLGIAAKTPFTLEADADQSFNGSSWKSTIEAEMPLMLGFGGSYRIGEHFTLAIDYELRQFQDKKITYTESESSSSVPLSDNNEDLNQFRVGAEYLIVMKGGVVPVRAGYRTVPSVLANYAWDSNSQSYYPSGQVSGTGYSLGTGFISTGFALDFAYTRERLDDQEWTDAGTKLYTNSYAADRFSLSLIIYF